MANQQYQGLAYTNTLRAPFERKGLSRELQTTGTPDRLSPAAARSAGRAAFA
jgi:hypothetical protein